MLPLLYATQTLIMNHVRNTNTKMNYILGSLNEQIAHLDSTLEA